VPVPLQVRAGVNVVPEQEAATQVVPVTYSRQAPAPLQVPSLPQAAAPPSVHWFSGSCPAATLVQVPSVPASAHDLQVAVQAVAQQIPWAQMLFAQSLFAVQVAPLGRFVHTPVEQMFGDTQSVSAPQVVLQAPVPHVYGSHIEVVAVWQVPVPLQVRADVSVEPVQVAETQVVPAAYSRQAPIPSHVPSRAHVPDPSSGHWASGSWPLGTLVHVPGVPESAHDWQRPVQVVWQQTPCAQWAELHSVSPPQVAPIGLRPQLPPLQVLGDAQSADVEQVVLQAFVPHANGVQLDEVAVWQMPLPLQVRAGVNVVPEQVAATHWVPAP